MKTDGRRRTAAETRRGRDADKKQVSPYRYSIRLFIAASAPRRFSLSLLFLFASLAFSACNVGERQSGIPPAAQATIETVTRDISEEHYEKIYTEAAEEWRREATLGQSNNTFSTLKTKLGNVRGRTLLTGKQQQNTNNGTASNSLVLRFNTTFERGEGMETFTLLERDGRWLLAGYSVNSNALK